MEIPQELKRITLVNFQQRFPNEEEAIRFNVKFGLIPSKEQLILGQCCPKCGYRMIAEKRQSLKIGWSLRCSRTRCGSCRNCKRKSRSRFPCTKRCRTNVNPLTNTWIVKRKLTITQILQLTYCFIIQLDLKIVCQQLEISSTTVIDWLYFCRDICAHVVRNSCRIGGPGFDVEVDSTLLCKLKHLDGEEVPKRAGVWIVGGICRETKECFFVKTVDRDKETIHRILQQYIQPGTTIISDSSDSYTGLEELGMGDHFVINYAQSFAETEVYPHPDGEEAGSATVSVHINTMKGLWRDVKKSVKVNRQYTKKEVPMEQERDLVSSYLYRYMYFRNTLYPLKNIDERFVKFLMDVKTIYPGLVDVKE